MSKAPSPYSVETLVGTLELSKGAYLTMMKRKNSTIKTLCKSKQISHSCNVKPTMKKSKKLTYSYVADSKAMKSSVKDRSLSRSTKGKMFKSVQVATCVKN